MRIRKYIIQILFACFLIGCASPNEKLLSSLVYYDGCTSACWIGIEVGKTSFEQTHKILVDRYTAPKTVVVLDSLVFWLPNEVDFSNGSVTFSQGVVDGVVVLFENSRFIAEDAINVLGEPSDVIISIEVNESQRQCAGMQLSYSEIGVEVFLDVHQIFKGASKTQLVTGFSFMSPEDLQDMQLKAQSNGISTVVDWQGYKDYCEIISLPPKIP